MLDSTPSADSASIWRMVTRSSLRLRIVTVLLTVSLLPLLLLGIGAWIVFGRLLEKKSLELQQSVVERHARAIESHLFEHRNALRLIADTHHLNELTDQAMLADYLDKLNRATLGGFVDLGVIGADGDHLAYVGPYDLMRVNYSATDWFKEIASKGDYISDVFLGFRKVPHCIIAVRSFNGERPWILRATINSDQFDALVRTTALGETGEAYIVNRQGLFQTTSRSSRLLEPSSIHSPLFFEDLVSEKTNVDGIEVVRVTRWINNDRWLLVVQQDASEVRAPVDRAIALGALNVLLAVVVVALTTFLATWHLTNRIDKANREKEEMFRAFMRSAKLASIGELATGFAHEINNPLAIIAADQTNIGDVVADLDGSSESTKEILESVARCQRQIQRCKSITTKMLRFGRNTEIELRPTEIGRHLVETAKLLQRRASEGNVELMLQIDEGLPPVLVNEVELEQVIVNLVNNSLYASPQGGHVTITARRSGREVIVEVIDDGMGIPPQHLDRIFEPFFTTKPTGKGTGLGLSVCYGIVQSWGGRMETQSVPGKGTTMRIRIPVSTEMGSNQSTEVDNEH